MSLRRRCFDKVATLLLCNIVFVKPLALETCSDSIIYFIGFNAEYLQCKG